MLELDSRPPIGFSPYNTFPTVQVPARCSATTSIAWMNRFQEPVWVVVRDDSAPHFLVDDLVVFQDSQLCSTGRVPASLFAEGSPRDELLLNPATGVNKLTLTVTNASDQARTFEALALMSRVGGRLARYRRALVAGLGCTRIGPLGSLRLVVQPNRAISPDRLFVPRDLLARVDCTVMEVREWLPAGGDGRLVDYVDSRYLTRENLAGDGCVVTRSREPVGPEQCLVLRFENRIAEALDVTGAVLGGAPVE